MSLLQNINHPDDFKKIDFDSYPQLAQEIRDRLIQVTSVNGGHIGPNLGVVELTLALHHVFDVTKDQFTFDVSHQGYVHKLLTGRNGPEFDKLRKSGGVSGFLSRDESPFDNYGAGHAGTALSAALGMAVARDLKGSDEHIVSIIGDAALTCGITMEAMNNIATSTKRMTVILNDNEWSIAKNVGAIAQYLNGLITNPVYNKINKDLETLLAKVPGGKQLLKLGSKAKQETKDFVVSSSSLFENYGLRYIGPIDGHNTERLVEYLTFCREFVDQPVLLHVVTKKGKGYEVATSNPQKFHGTGPYCTQTGESKGGAPSAPKYETVFGQAIAKEALRDKAVTGITAAMPSGTGLIHLEKAAPEQFFDVGIAEEHAVLFAAGMATQGLKPVCAIYSTFLQRAVDPIIHDVCLQDLDVTFCMDRAGLSANDGPTHHGLFDIAYLRGVPNTILMQPKDEDELCDMLHTCLKTPKPTFMRYPRGAGVGVTIKDKPETLEIGKAQVMNYGSKVALWGLGPMVYECMGIAQTLKAQYGIEATVVNGRFAKPLDEDLLLEHAKSHELIVSVEDHVRTGGFGSAIQDLLGEHNVKTQLIRMGWPDEFVDHGSSNGELRERYGFTAEAIIDSIVSALRVEEESVVGAV